MKGRLMVRSGIAAALALAIVGLPGVAVAATPGPPQAPEWWFDAWQVDNLWAAGADGRGITVAVVDTGVQASLPELQGKVLSGADFIGNGSDGRTDYDSDAFSHGTAMASIIVARLGLGDVAGLAPAARILPLAVPLRGVIRNGTPTDNATAAAINYAADHGAQIISMSLGGLSLQSGSSDPCPGPLQSAVLHALSKGSLVVAASGNSGEQGSPVEEPGVCLGVVSVGSIDRQLNVSAFSSRHPYLTVSAPGDNIPSLSRSSAFIGEGTSQATAMTSAALALIWSKYPRETNRQILTRLLDTVTDRGAVGRDPSYGLGIINPAAAIAAKPAAAAAANVVFDGAQPLLVRSGVVPANPKSLPETGDANSALGVYSVGKPPRAVSAEFYIVVLATGTFALFAALLLIVYVRRKVARPVLYGLR